MLFWEVDINQANRNKRNVSISPVVTQPVPRHASHPDTASIAESLFPHPAWSLWTRGGWDEVSPASLPTRYSAASSVLATQSLVSCPRQTHGCFRIWCDYFLSSVTLHSVLLKAKSCEFFSPSFRSFTGCYAFSSFCWSPRWHLPQKWFYFLLYSWLQVFLGARALLSCRVLPLSGIVTSAQ